MSQPETLNQERRDLRAYLEEQAEVVFGDDNLYFAGQKLGHKPSPEEAWRHWVKSGAAKRWRELKSHSC